MDKHVLLHNGIVDAQVCSDGTHDEALAWIRKDNPAGTENNWSKNEEDKMAPVACNGDKGRTHYMFTC